MVSSYQAVLIHYTLRGPAVASRGERVPSLPFSLRGPARISESSNSEWGKGGIAASRGEKWAKKWRPQCKAVKYSIRFFGFTDKLLSDNVLRFNPIQIAEWLLDLLDSGVAESQRGLEEYLGIDRTRVGQFLRLRRLPEATQAELRNMPDLNEFRLRRVVGAIAPQSN